MAAEIARQKAGRVPASARSRRSPANEGQLVALPQPTASTTAILAVASALLAVSSPEIESRGLTLIGIALTNLSDEHALQLTLPFDRARELDTALDRIRDRFGSDAIVRAALVGRDWHVLLDCMRFPPSSTA